MEALLLSLLNELARIGENHEELFDSDVRQAMSNAIVDGFARSRGSDAVPHEFGLFSESGNRAVHEAIRRFVLAANRTALEVGLQSFHDRLAAVQNPDVRTSDRYNYDEFLGHSPPEFFDANGDVIRIF